VTTGGMSAGADVARQVYDAAWRGDETELHRLLRQGASPNWINGFVSAASHRWSVC